MDRLAELVKEKLEYSALQAGTGKYDMHKINIPELCGAVINQFAALSEKNGITIESDIESGLYADCDSRSIARVMLIS